MQTYIKINLSNIIDNYKKIQEFTNKQIIAIIKDNAYGHGLIQVGKMLSSINSFTNTLDESLVSPCKSSVGKLFIKTSSNAVTLFAILKFISFNHVF